MPLTTPEIQALRETARAARSRADDYRRVHEHDLTATAETDQRAGELDRLAFAASTALAMGETQWRAEARARRRADAVAADASLQARLRAETRARHEARLPHPQDPPPAARG